MVNNKSLKSLIEILMTIEDPKEMKLFLEGILTPKELEEIPMRLEIVRMIKQGVPHQKIAEKLGVGVATVTRGSKEIQRGRFEAVK